MSPELAAVTFGLFAAASWGAGDFNGGLATRQANVLNVIFVSQLIGIILLFAAAIVTAEIVPPLPDLVWGAAAGVSGMIGLSGLYRALAIGRAGIVAPISASVSAVLPVLFSLFTLGLPGLAQVIGFVLAFVSIILVSYSSSTEATQANGISLAFLAGIGFGISFICLGQIQSEAVFWPWVAARITSLTMMLIFWRFRRGDGPLIVLPSWPIILAGVLDAAGNVFFLLATQSGRLDIAAVVGAMYPAVTILLARLVLKEYLSRIQSAGIVAALLAVGLIAL